MSKVSVIIPVCNVEKYLRACLDSVVNQTLRDIEIICVDDGSTDSSPAVLAEYAAKDPRVKVVTCPKSNAGAARNAGMAVATGEYLGFVDADDFCELSLFERAYDAAKAVDADLVSWGYDQFDAATGRFVAPRLFSAQSLALSRPYAPEALGASIFSPLAFGPWGRMVRRELVVNEKIRFQSLQRSNDVCFCCLALALSARQTLLNEVLYHYRVGQGGNLQSGNAKTPFSVVEAWEAVAAELNVRGLFAHFRKAVAEASAGSFFYTLSTLPDEESYGAFYERLRSAYRLHPVFAQTKAEDMGNDQVRTFFRMLESSDTAFGFLVQQQKYYRRSLGRVWLDRNAVQQENVRQRREAGKQAAALARVSEERTKLVGELAKATEERTRLSAGLAKAAEERTMLAAELAKTAGELEFVRNSRSYRIGKVVTTPVGWVRDLLGARKRGQW